MNQNIYPIPFSNEIIKESEYTAFINDILFELEKIFTIETINKKWPKDLRARPELLKILSLPEGNTIYLDGSPLTHTIENNAQHAIDFLVPVGTPVQAIQTGEIIHLEDCFNDYGIAEEFGNKCNVVSIVHPDDTMSEYIHLTQGSPSRQGIRKGSVVQQGDIIGYTGTSGRMDLPHLHFALYDVKKESYYSKIYGMQERVTYKNIQASSFLLSNTNQNKI